MKIPNFERASIPAAKIIDYLLSESHRDGRHKAAFFRRFGYDPADWQRLQKDLLQHGNHDVVAVETSPFGTRYVVEGIMVTPDLRTPKIRTIWYIERGTDSPRLATAYPSK